MLNLSWRPAGTPTATTLACPPGFSRLGAGKPDVFVRSDSERACIVVAHGCYDESATFAAKVASHKPLSGLILIANEAGTALAARKVQIRYGCAEVFRIGKASEYQATTEWTSFWLRHMPTEPAAQASVFQRLAEDDYGFDDTPFTNPDQSGSARVFQSCWAGTLGAALDIGREKARLAGEAFTDFQLRWRHVLFYDDTGYQLRSYSNPWWRVGPKGWDGTEKWESDSPYMFETVQHLAPDIFCAMVMGWNDYAAQLYSVAYSQAVATRPEFRSSQLADDQRSHGYAMRLAALWCLAPSTFAEERDAALLRVVDGWRRANGFAPMSGEPYASIAPAKTGKWGHGYPSLVDWLPYSKAHNLVHPKPPVPGGTCDHMIADLEVYAQDRKLPKNAYTFGKDGLWQGHTIVWQTAVALGALCAIRDIPAAAALVPDIHKLIQHATACIVGPGMRPGIGVDGGTVQPNPFHDAYCSRFPSRVTKGAGKNGTSTWVVNPLLAALPSLGDNLRDQAKLAASTEWNLTDFPSPPDLETTGLLPISTFGPKP